MADDTVTVAVRLRPMDESEAARVSANGAVFEQLRRVSPGANGGALRRVVAPIDDRMLVFDPPLDGGGPSGPPGPRGGFSSSRSHEQKFVFDHVLPETASQREVFERTTKHLIPDVLLGVNTSVFAYGATGCGKTHTISGTRDDPGIMFLALAELFGLIDENQRTKTIVANVSYVEIYNENLRDLLVEQTPETRPLQLRDTDARQVVVAGLSTHPFDSVDRAMQLVAEGNGRRAMSATAANATSSRSHAILSIEVRVTSDRQQTRSVFNIIDLAGSERAAATENRGIRLTEGACINRSLLALGTCIKALAGRKRVYVPYRDSKLTRLLKSSLSGSCRTVMIVCVAPTSKHFEETLNTLNYANRAKNIRARPVRNETRVNGHVQAYRQRITQLQAENAVLKDQLNDHEGGATGGSANGMARVREAIQTVEGISAFYAGSRSEFVGAYCTKRELLARSNELKLALELVPVLATGEARDRAVAQIEAELAAIREQYNGLNPDRMSYAQFIENEHALRRAELEQAGVSEQLLQYFDTKIELLIQRNEVQVLGQLLDPARSDAYPLVDMLKSLHADGHAN